MCHRTQTRRALHGAICANCNLLTLGLALSVTYWHRAIALRCYLESRRSTCAAVASQAAKRRARLPLRFLLQHEAEQFRLEERIAGRIFMVAIAGHDSARAGNEARQISVVGGAAVCAAIEDEHRQRG